MLLIHFISLLSKEALIIVSPLRYKLTRHYEKNSSSISDLAKLISMVRQLKQDVHFRHEWSGC